MASTRQYYLLASIFFTILKNHISSHEIFPITSLLSENATLEFIGLATKYGHSPTEYEVVTEDGYILTLFRIAGRSKCPVLLMHGLLDTSDIWLLRGEHSLGITLANDGYDVWFGNSRGNRYSRRHVSLDPDTEPLYWSWSFHKLGYYDLPAIIDTILNKTGEASLTAIGHSRGNMMFYVLGSTRPEYNTKVNVMIALAPICYLHHIQPPLSSLFELIPPVIQLYDKLHLNATEAFGYNCTSTKLLRAICNYPLIGPDICRHFIIFPIMGFDPSELESSFVNTFTFHFPAGSSWMDLLHFDQVRRRREFAQFDYGEITNLLVYNTTSPPLYDLSKVTMPVALLSARNDHLSTVPDVDILSKQLPNVVEYKINRRALMNHADFVCGKHMHFYLFPDINRVLRQYNGIQ